MSEMVDRVARALRDADLGAETMALMSPDEMVDWVASWEKWKRTEPWIIEKWTAQARAAIAAMLEPTEHMLAEGWPNPGDAMNTKDVWQQMIDAALADSPATEDKA